jgi:hypothetical protein
MTSGGMTGSGGTTGVAGAAGVGVGATIGAGAGVGSDAGDGLAGRVPGLAGSEGCKGAAGAGIGTGRGAGEGVAGAVSRDGVEAGAGEAAADIAVDAVNALARACVIRSTFLTSCFLRISILESSSFAFLT